MVTGFGCFVRAGDVEEGFFVKGWVKKVDRFLRVVHFFVAAMG